MKLNKVLQTENDRLKEELDDLRDHDIITFVWSWDMFQENRRLWEEYEGFACDLFPLYNPLKKTVLGYAIKEEKGKTRIADLGTRKLRRRERKCSI